MFVCRSLACLVVREASQLQTDRQTDRQHTRVAAKWQQVPIGSPTTLPVVRRRRWRASWAQEELTAGSGASGSQPARRFRLINGAASCGFSWSEMWPPGGPKTTCASWHSSLVGMFFEPGAWRIAGRAICESRLVARLAARRHLSAA